MHIMSQTVVNTIGSKAETENKSMAETLTHVYVQMTV